MTQVILDPDDSSVGFIGSSTDNVFGAAIGEATLNNIHPATQCAGRSCIIHAPTNHHMREWRLHWRDDRGIFERICPDGIGHPDPDQFEYWARSGQDWHAVHGCDGCCSPPDNTTHHAAPVGASGIKRCTYCKVEWSRLGEQPEQQVCPDAPK